MTTYRLPYGHAALEVDLAPAAARGHTVLTVAPREVQPAADPAAAVEAAIEAAPLPAYHGGGCVIAINDRTRPVPHDLLLPPLLRRLERAGVARRDVLLLIATGTHRVMTPDQYADVVPPAVLGRYQVACHDAHDSDRLAYVGETSRGTPIWINAEYLARELRLVVGVIEPHQFVGFSGGAKSAAIGLGGYITIGRNHSMMTHPLSRIGQYEDNPCRQDIDEIGERLGVHLALNVVLGSQARILAAFAGPPLEVMRRGVPCVRSLNQVEVGLPFDLMLVSPGGHPKDTNVYQAQKALAHAALVTRPGGTILLAAACPDGTGSSTYENWMSRADMTSHEAVIARFARDGYALGAHKAFQISRDASRFRVALHSEMPPELTERLLLTPAPDFQQAVADAVDALAPGSRIGVMPRANATIPVATAGAS